ncbi:hypothetical protein ABH966_003353 [Lysinibacillus sp. RC46]
MATTITDHGNQRLRGYGALHRWIYNVVVYDLHGQWKVARVP